MDIQDIVEVFQDGSAIKIAAVLITILVVIIAIVLGKRNMGKMGANWSEVAASHGLQYAPNAITYDYGLVVGNHSFDYPGIVGNYRGRAVQVQTSTATSGSDAGKWVFDAVVTLNSPKPYSALAYKRGFENLVKNRVKQDGKTGNRAIDSNFKVRSEDTAFVTQVFERINLVDWLKQEKYKSAHIIIDGDKLVFRGAVTGYSTSPEQAMALLNILCDIADAAR